MPATGPTARDFDRERTSVILGVSGTLPLVIPLGARLGHPIWRQALAEAGVDPETGEDVIARIADGLCAVAGELFPRTTGQRGSWPDRQPARFARNQLHRRRGMRLVLECHPSRIPRARSGSGRHGPERWPGHVQRHLHVHVLLEDTRAFSVGERTAVQPGRGRYDSGRRCRGGGAQAFGGRRAGRRSNLRGHQGPGVVERRQGSGGLRALSRRPSTGATYGVSKCGCDAGHGRARRGPRHGHHCGRRHRGTRPHQCL